MSGVEGERSANQRQQPFTDVLFNEELVRALVDALAAWRDDATARAKRAIIAAERRAPATLALFDALLGGLTDDCC